jgi:hypothetical protein
MCALVSFGVALDRRMHLATKKFHDFSKPLDRRMHLAAKKFHDFSKPLDKCTAPAYNGINS